MRWFRQRVELLRERNKLEAIVRAQTAEIHRLREERAEAKALLWNLTRNLHEAANAEEEREEAGEVTERTLLIEGAGLDGVGTFSLSAVFRGAARAAYDAWKIVEGAAR